MLHPAFELLPAGDGIGYGLFASRAIPKGTITWALDPLDRALAREDERRLPASMRPALEKYGYIDASGRRIVCWDLAKYMNHSCRPASLRPGVPFELAVRDIPRGGELTCDYGGLNVEVAFTCLCGEPHCRRTIRPDDILSFAVEWNMQVRDAARSILHVPQPLWSLVPDKDLVERATVRPELLPSTALNYRPPARQAVAR